MDSRIEVEIAPGICFVWALMLLVLPLRWVLGAVLAAVIHELWHFAAIVLFGGSVRRISIGTSGAVMETQMPEGWQGLICAAAGPIGSFSLLLTARFFPVTAICGFVQGIFNLLPLFPLDGGRIMRGVLELLLHSNGRRISGWIEYACLVLLLIGGFAVLFNAGASVVTVLFVILPLMRLLQQKKTLQRIETGGTIEIH